MKFKALILALALDCLPTTAYPQAVSADDAAPAVPEPAASGDIWRLMMSPLTVHYDYDAEHRHVYMLGLEKQRADGYLLGGAWFRNSFGQPSAYVYVGRRFNHFTDLDPLFLQVSGGLLYGYVAPHSDEVPLNYRGFSPGAVLGVGWQFTRAYSAQLNLLGTAALMLQFSVDLR